MASGEEAASGREAAGAYAHEVGSRVSNSNPFAPKDFSVLPKAIWLPRFGSTVYRGTPSQVVVAIASQGGEPAKSVKAAIRLLVEDLTRSHKARVQVPWEQPEAALAKAFVKALLQSSIAKAVPEA
jgi:hypothetical protein